MKIEDVFSLTKDEEKIQKLKSQRGAPGPDVAKISDQWRPDKHEVMNPAYRPDKTIKKPDPQDPEKEISSTEKVNRVAMALQKLIVKRAAAFLFGNSVVIHADPVGEQQQSVLKAVNRILKDAKIDSRNRAIAKNMFASTEVAEYWYPVEAPKESQAYGFKTKVKMKMQIFSPLLGDALYPFFDDSGDMTAFSREFIVSDSDNNKVLYFETWTDKLYIRWKQGAGGQWEKAMAKENIDGITNQVGKIPIIYGRQEQVEWADVQTLIDRLEKLFSNYGDTNDYHAAPKIFIKGELTGFAKKGESGAILQGTRDADAKYLSWDQAPESVKLELDSLLRMIYAITQTPDISFESVKGLGSAASGQGLKMLFLDAHLKVMEKMEVFDEYLQRRLNLIKAFISQLSTSLQSAADELDITPVVIPYMIGDNSTIIGDLVDAVQGGIISKATAVSHNPYVEDADAELARINEETDQVNTSSTELDKLQNQ